MTVMYVKPLPDGKFACKINGKTFIQTANQVVNSPYKKILESNVGPAPVKPFSL